VLRILPLIVLVAFLAGCKYTPEYSITRLSGQPPVLPSDCSVYVSLPKDGWYSSYDSPRSGAATARAVVEGFSAYARKVEGAGKVASTDENLDAAAAGRFTYLADPIILHWEDAATSWGRKSDTITIQITVYDVAQRSVVDRATIKGKGGWDSYGVYHPEDLLATPVNDYVGALFGQAKAAAPAK